MYYLHNTYYIAQIHYLLLFLITIITKISKKAHEILKNNCDFWSQKILCENSGKWQEDKKKKDRCWEKRSWIEREKTKASKHEKTLDEIIVCKTTDNVNWNTQRKMKSNNKVSIKMPKTSGFLKFIICNTHKNVASIPF